MQKEIIGDSGLKCPIYWKYLVSEIHEKQEGRRMYHLIFSPEKKKQKPEEQSKNVQINGNVWSHENYEDQRIYQWNFSAEKWKKIWRVV